MGQQRHRVKMTDEAKEEAKRDVTPTKCVPTAVESGKKEKRGNCNCYVTKQQQRNAKRTNSRRHPLLVKEERKRQKRSGASKRPTKNVILAKIGCGARLAAGSTQQSIASGSKFKGCRSRTSIPLLSGPAPLEYDMKPPRNRLPIPAPECGPVHATVTRR